MFGTPISGGLMFGRPISGGLMFGRPISGGLMFGGPISGGLMFGRPISGGLMFGRLPGNGRLAEVLQPSNIHVGRLIKLRIVLYFYKLSSLMKTFNNWNNLTGGMF